MNTLDYKALKSMVSRRQLAQARNLTVGQVRIAAVPGTVGLEREGAFDPAWLLPIPASMTQADLSLSLLPI
jgi:hypothetical protein